MHLAFILCLTAYKLFDTLLVPVVCCFWVVTALDGQKFVVTAWLQQGLDPASSIQLRNQDDCQNID